jgi:hypothetical protein
MSHQRQTCSDCGKRSPETETNYTLISSAFGWRLSKEPNGTLEPLVKWRCPECWKKFKASSKSAHQ